MTGSGDELPGSGEVGDRQDCCDLAGDRNRLSEPTLHYAVVLYGIRLWLERLWADQSRQQSPEDHCNARL